MIYYNKKFTGQESTDITERELKNGALIRRAAAEGMVLLENNGVLPLDTAKPVAVFGGGAMFPIKGGTGSGSVNSRSVVSLYDGLKNAGLTIADEEWLQNYVSVYQNSRTNWMNMVIDLANAKEKGNRAELYAAHASHPFQMPNSGTIPAVEADTAIYVISRVSGEAADRSAVKGDYYLSEAEEAELKQVCELYANTIVVLNIGGVIDMNYIDSCHPAAVVLMSQAGMESGNSLADVLVGNVNPCGRLTDTWSKEYLDIPSSAAFSHNNGNVIEEEYKDGIYVGYKYFDSFEKEVRYPFGYGLSYTEFALKTAEVTVGEKITVRVEVTNVGKRAGKEVVQLYTALPPGIKDKEFRRLSAFAKTGVIEPGQTETVSLEFGAELLSSYHTAKAYSYLDEGEYILQVGTSAADTAVCGVLKLHEMMVLEQLSNVCELLVNMKEIRPSADAHKAYHASLLKEAAENGAAVLDLDEHVKGCIQTMEEKSSMRKANPDYIYDDAEMLAKARSLVKEMTLEEKAQILCGQVSGGSTEFIGRAAVHVPGAAGETSSVLASKGVGTVVLSDGPAGLRLQQHYEESKEDGSILEMTPYEALVNRFFATEFLHEDTISHYQFCSAIPIGLLLAQTFDTALMEEVGVMIGREMQEFGVGIWLAPGMNIHRNPLCGRNYEYYSEDPLLTGKMAAAITRGVQQTPGLSVTIKHYACNNQEDNRMGVSSVVSERALRELYLKGFEIAVKDADPKAVMTSYNRLNAVHTANSKDLCTTILREEWGFRGIVMTDWTTTAPRGGSNPAKCIKAGNDLIMPGTVEDIQEIIVAVQDACDVHLDMQDVDACAERVLYLILTSLGFAA